MEKSDIQEHFRYEDGDLIWIKRISQRGKIGKVAGYRNKQGYIIIKCKNGEYLAHRLIFMLHHGYYPIEVDHEDGNPSNNRITNLRAATRQQNSFNTKTKASSRTGVKGVGIHKPTGHYKVSIKVNGKSIHLGYTTDIEEAKKMYEEASKLYHGDFRRKT